MSNTILVALVLLALVSGRADATTYIAPQRELVEGEILAMSVGTAGAIVVGYPESVYDTTVIASPDGDIRHLLVMQLHVERVLKGPVRVGTLRVVKFPDIMIVADKAGQRGPLRVPVAGAPPRRLVILLSDLNKRRMFPRETYLGASQRISRWGMSENRSPYSVPGFQDWNVFLEDWLRREIERQQPEALTRASDRVVIANFAPPEPGGSMLLIDRIRVERTLKGPPSTAPLKMSFVLPIDDPGPQVLMFLKRVGPGEYEPTILRAAIVPVRGNQVPFWQCSLDSAIARVERSNRESLPRH